MVTVLTSEFFWGVVVGLILSLVGNFALTKFQRWETVALQRDTIRSFSLDTVLSIRRYVTEMQSIRDRINSIEGDLLALIENEVQIFGRNREHVIRLDSDVREALRGFLNECAIRTVQIRFYLNEFSRMRPINTQQANEALTQANRAADQLVTAARGTDRLVNMLGG